MGLWRYVGFRGRVVRVPTAVTHAPYGWCPVSYYVNGDLSLHRPSIMSEELILRSYNHYAVTLDVTCVWTLAVHCRRVVVL